jgi:Kdo2-lipid IVA lauroyltransferase/acyltransferase
MNRARQLVEAAAVGVAYGLARVLPRRALLAVGGALGAAVGRVDRRRSEIAKDNLAHALGASLTTPERERLLRACWRHFGRITLDALAFPRLRSTDVGRVLVPEGAEHIREAFARGKGVLVFSAHFGHWEAGAILFGQLGYPFSVITRPLDNPILERLLARLRRGSGNAVIHKRRAVKETMRALAAGAGVAILIDQDARDEGVFVPYFGRPASTTPTLALLALRTGAAVLPVFARVRPDGRISVHAEPPMTVEPTGDREGDILRVTAECTAVVERWVRRYPEQWLWMHRRWKTRPPGEGA